MLTAWIGLCSVITLDIGDSDLDYGKVEDYVMHTLEGMVVWGGGKRGEKREERGGADERVLFFLGNGSWGVWWIGGS